MLHQSDNLPRQRLELNYRNMLFRRMRHMEVACANNFDFPSLTAEKVGFSHETFQNSDILCKTIPKRVAKIYF